jgi:hypothetical protein
MLIAKSIRIMKFGASRAEGSAQRLSLNPGLIKVHSRMAQWREQYGHPGSFDKIANQV